MADLSWGDLTPAQREVLDIACRGERRPECEELTLLGLLWAPFGAFKDVLTPLGRKVWEERG